MPIAMKCTHESTGFSLLELLITLVISAAFATAVIPQLQQRFKQAAVDSYTSKLEAGINQLKANMIGRQDSCKINFPSGAGSEVEINPMALESLQIDTTGEGTDCPQPTDMNGLDMASTELRMTNLKGSLTNQQRNDLRLLISPTSISMTTVGGVSAPDATTSNQPLIIRVRSRTLHNQAKGFERCLSLEPMTGSLIRGTWIGGNFAAGSCRHNQ
jgi:prepilin-type N-terminal cleavage/methylation domain-containing protein